MRSSALRTILGLACGLVIAVAANDAAAGPSNDACVDSIIITNGPTAYSTLGAATDGVETPGDCGIFGDENVHNEIWFDYNADFTGTLQITTCEQLGGSADYDSRLAAYETCACPADNANFLGCNDDDPNNPCGAGGGGFHSTLEIPVVSGTCYKIRVGGFSDGDIGTGTLQLNKLVPTGACCVGVNCVVLPQDQCVAQGGNYQGDGTDCGVSYAAKACGNAFEDIAGTGTQLFLGDDDGEFVPLGFTFNFFGDDHTDIAVSSNGYLTFGTDLTDFTNDPIPTTILPNDFIAPLWDDFNPSVGGTVHYQTLGTAPNRQFIAQWTNVPQFAMADSNTFQAILGEASNCIQFRYGAFTPEALAGDYTVGVENQDGTEGLGLDASMLSPGDCVSICPAGGICQPQCPWDLDGGGSVGILDLLALLAAWGANPGHPADFDGDDIVGILDLLILLANWGPCP